MPRPKPSLSQLVSDFGAGFTSAAGVAPVVDASPLWTPLAPEPGRGIALPDGRVLSPQQLACESAADELCFGGGPGGGKRLANDTLVPVPLYVDSSGYKRHGDLSQGDAVYSPSGTPILVEWVSPIVTDTDAYQVEFDTGEVVIADGDHLWHTWTRYDRKRLLLSSEEWRAERRRGRPSTAKAISKKPGVSRNITLRNQTREYHVTSPTGGVRTTRELALTLHRTDGGLNHSIDTCVPITSVEQALPIEPYLFGLWLGDGTSSAPAIGMAKADWDELAQHVPRWNSESVDTRQPRTTPFITRRFSFMLPHLRALSVLKDKHIPAIYLRASVSQRISLLQGLLDTDGSCGKSGQITLGFSNKRLAEDAFELVASLGIKAAVSVKHPKISGRPSAKCADHFWFKFVAPFMAFRLYRKSCRQKLGPFRVSTTRRFISDARRVASVPMRCIKVASQDGLYLVGRSFIATHNTDLILGLALTQHRNSIIFRREFTQFTGPTAMIERSSEIIGVRGNYNGFEHSWRNLPGGRALQFAGVQHEKDRRKWMGRPHDGKFFDELPQIPERLYRFLITWLRTTYPGQRTRVVATANPPMTDEERWVLAYWGPWLDKHHPNPAKPGELRWFIVDESGKDVEVPGPAWGTARPAPVRVGERLIQPRSRTFIPSQVEDNPHYMRTGYAEVLDALPEPLRSLLRFGEFKGAVEDHPYQVIPTAWIDAAQRRWTPDGGKDVRLSTVGVDTSRGGSDEFVIAKRHQQWIDKLNVHSAKEAKDGQAGAVLIYRAIGGSDSHDVPVQIDLGGGSGPSVYDHCRGLHMRAVGLDGSRKSTSTDKTKRFGFFNKRAQWHWRMRELLDPANKHELALPPDQQLRSDLCAPRWELRLNRIKIEEKTEIKKRIGRSPDRGEAVIYACGADGEAPLMVAPSGVGDAGYWGKLGDVAD